MTSVKDMKIDNPQLIDQIKDVYGSGVRHLDGIIGKLYELIKARYPNTIIIITSDHGEAFMEHGMFHHEACSLYNELIKVPLLIHFPSKKKKVVKEVVSTVSLAKTICSLLDIKNDAFDGTDLTKKGQDVLENHVSRILYKCISPSIRFQIFDADTEIKGFNELLSYSTSQYKYIIEKGGKVEEFYDLEIDPMETKNIVRTIPKNIRSTLKKKLENLS